jgi:hypothetical protein
MSMRRWLPWVAALAVLVVTAVVVLLLPDGHACRGTTHPVRVTTFVGTGSHESVGHFWVCDSNVGESQHLNLGEPEHYHGYLAATDSRASLRLGIVLAGVGLAVALGVGLHKAYPPAPRTSTGAPLPSIADGS